MEIKLQELQSKLKYNFFNPQLLLEALSHPAAKSTLKCNYERLEFLGDRVLNLIVAETLFSQYPGENEGKLAKRHNFLVCKDSVFKAAEKIELQKFVLLPEGDKLLALTPSTLVDAMEAVIAAVYLDSSIYTAKKVVLNLWKDALGCENTHLDHDSKSILQELMQSRQGFIPKYSTHKIEGSDHEPCFESKITLPSGNVAFGRGKSKKFAEKEAAAMALKLFEKVDLKSQ
jgi:ribonuclease-3